jgi:hypothetical protein
LFSTPAASGHAFSISFNPSTSKLVFVQSVWSGEQPSLLHLRFTDSGQTVNAASIAAGGSAPIAQKWCKGEFPSLQKPQRQKRSSWKTNHLT